MHAPRWAHQPLSGAGAAARGGRWNRPGVPALYMSREFSTAVAEYEQELGIRPGTLCAYDVRASAVADLTDPDTLDPLGAAAPDLLCPWALIARGQGRDPPTWTLADRLLAGGAEGVLAPSAQAPGGVNFVVWRWEAETGDGMRVGVLDPLGDLPLDQASWRNSRS
jgi:RES domain-containing protein